MDYRYYLSSEGQRADHTSCTEGSVKRYRGYGVRLFSLLVGNLLCFVCILDEAPCFDWRLKNETGADRLHFVVSRDGT